MIRTLVITLAAAVFAVLPARAETVRNGNELALAYSRADAAGQAALRREAEGRLFTFRFLKVVRIEPPAHSNAPPVFVTLEPSSDLTVILHPQGAVSLQVASTVVTNDGLAVNGRLARIDPLSGAFTLRPAALRHKDRTAPKGEKELLPEIDPRARK